MNAKISIKFVSLHFHAVTKRFMFIQDDVAFGCFSTHRNTVRASEVLRKS